MAHYFVLAAEWHVQIGLIENVPWVWLNAAAVLVHHRATDRPRKGIVEDGSVIVGLYLLFLAVLGATVQGRALPHLLEIRFD